ncbi:SDR family oxidoreductase [Mesobacterium sp. TK19101]|uniref:SDR family oxidoreductase n=1 Tax=Mesobacterium hydrothermale TaxID=3111907 RepID=A0ABU6HGK5_9RHOB|nr:SDR family oxidoreductase [Mesobacterium sp. TK19101]MEC3860588.1 SDR family oxidoreductase [Mesobacterium sp. TK19101]
MTRVLITGGATGLGRAMAEGFAAQGARVAVCDADPAAVAALQSDRPDIRAAQADVTDEAAMGWFLKGLEDDWQGIDVVCANAGIGGPAGRIEELDYTDWMRCIEVNLGGVFLTCRWAARLMRAQGSGAIILTSSTSGQWGVPLRSPYVAAKWGIVGLTKTLAMELGPAGVRVNAICPGAVEGDRMERVVAMEAAASGKSPDEVRAQYVRGVSLRAWVNAKDVTETVLWLASPQARMISGQVIAIDGHTESMVS